MNQLINISRSRHSAIFPPPAFCSAPVDSRPEQTLTQQAAVEQVMPALGDFIVRP
jgi:hypothetical protein